MKAKLATCLILLTISSLGCTSAGVTQKTCVQPFRQSDGKLPAWIVVPSWATTEPRRDPAPDLASQPKVIVEARFLQWSGDDGANVQDTEEPNRSEAMRAHQLALMLRSNSDNGWTLTADDADNFIDRVLSGPKTSMLSSPPIVLFEDQSTWVAIGGSHGGVVLFAKPTKISDSGAILKFSAQTQNGDVSLDGVNLSAWKAAAEGQIALRIGQCYATVIHPAQEDRNQLLLLRMIAISTTSNADEQVTWAAADE